jgi:hypothetical protein
MCPIWRVLGMEDVLGFCALVLTILMSLAIAVWFCCSIGESIVKMRRRHKKLRHKALLRENERLKSLLAEAAEENVHLKRYHAEIIRRKINGVSGTPRNGTRRHTRELPPGGIIGL